jgi:hypothetical protein
MKTAPGASPHAETNRLFSRYFDLPAKSSLAGSGYERTGCGDCPPIANCQSSKVRASVSRMNRVRLQPWLLWLLLCTVQCGAVAHAFDADAHRHGEICAVCAVLQAGDDAPPPGTLLFSVIPYHACAPAARAAVRTHDHRLRPGLIRAPPTPAII